MTMWKSLYQKRIPAAAFQEEAEPSSKRRSILGKEDSYFHVLGNSWCCIASTPFNLWPLIAHKVIERSLCRG